MRPGARRRCRAVVAKARCMPRGRRGPLGSALAPSVLLGSAGLACRVLRLVSMPRGRRGPLRSALARFIVAVPVGSAMLVRPSSGGWAPLPAARRPGLSRRPSLGARFIVVGLFFHISASGFVPAPVAVSRNIIARLVVWAFPACGGLPLSGSWAGSGRPAGGPAPSSLSLRSAQRCPSGGFFRLARCLAVRVAGCFPSVRWPEVCRPAPLPERPHRPHIFCPARGAGVAPCRARPSGPAPLAGAGTPRPPAPPRAARRGRRCFS